jgi:uncharacterized Zn finger protein (UPF0148 family)
VGDALPVPHSADSRHAVLVIQIAVSSAVVKRASKFRESNFDVTCPCCGAVLKIDAATRSIIAHTAPVKPKTFNDMEEAARAMKEQDSRRDSIFRQSMEAQKHASELLEKKFQEAVKKAKETPDTGRPIRDFDLD